MLQNRSFPKANRIRKRKEYLEFFTVSDLKKLGPCLVYRRPTNRGLPRLGITVKFKKSSVFRNRVKRGIREAFRHSRARLGSFDYNVVVTRIAPDARADQLSTKVTESLNKIWAGPSVAF